MNHEINKELFDALEKLPRHPDDAMTEMSRKNMREILGIAEPNDATKPTTTSAGPRVYLAIGAALFVKPAICSLTDEASSRLSLMATDLEGKQSYYPDEIPIKHQLAFGTVDELVDQFRRDLETAVALASASPCWRDLAAECQAVTRDVPVGVALPIWPGK